ncbi:MULTISPECIES: hypothetical protein [unclassified Bradyrhizobium]|uniref:hypothetical protein n=1 Tax=unclassified Bradyrhizobium TaxID=2631580 RepID=UPI001FFAA5C3|nr:MULTISPECIES: hypothetical protein [unclassified Bradyrhizobium]MCK1540330.1 hypothetical protein [Bradyrhizobium sp. 176]MCK1556172.1 hypothetical protein [Bradyrhizobium sp. 171]
MTALASHPDAHLPHRRRHARPAGVGQTAPVGALRGVAGEDAEHDQRCGHY